MKLFVRNIVTVAVVAAVGLCFGGFTTAYATETTFSSSEVEKYGNLYYLDVLRFVMPFHSVAAKYGTFDYLDEQEVTDYIMTYKEQMGYGDATDDEWAEFLATYNLTPDRLRYSTIVQLLSDRAVEQKCRELDITASDSEVDVVIEGLKYLYSFNDDEIWKSTLEMYGQTEEGVREVYRQEIMKEKLCDQEVATPEPTEEEVFSYIESFVATAQVNAAYDTETSEESDAILSGEGECTLRHSYCFKYDIAGDEATLDESDQVNLVRDEFVESGTDLETFVTILSLYSNDEECIDTNGDMGWDADTDEYSEIYERMLSSIYTPGVSSVFNDGDTICFIWVDQIYSLPYATNELEALDLSTMPESLYDYFSDCEAYELWQKASDVYVNDLVANMDVTLYEMPQNVPYNVDMSAYLVVEDDESTESDGSISTDAGLSSDTDEDTANSLDETQTRTDGSE